MTRIKECVNEINTLKKLLDTIQYNTNFIVNYFIVNSPWGLFRDNRNNEKAKKYSKVIDKQFGQPMCLLAHADAACKLVLSIKLSFKRLKEK